MPSLKSLRLRIRSVSNTRQITKTMKMVAAAKVRRARNAVENARPYAAELSNLLSGVVGGADASAPLLLRGRSEVKTVRLIVVGSDRGLCGSLNGALIRTTLAWVAEQKKEGRWVQLVLVGRKIRDGLKNIPGLNIADIYVDMGRTYEFAHAQRIAGEALGAFESGQVDEVHVLSSRFVSMLTQQPTFVQVIPFVKLEGGATAAPLYEPNEADVLAKLLPLNLNMQMFTALLETTASEQAARMTAMDSATRNAGQMIQKLSIQYNRSRQAAITKELIEIISGAEAV
jgi:F-type H+-transporting ATPase subunit gamma